MPASTWNNPWRIRPEPPSGYRPRAAQVEPHRSPDSRHVGYFLGGRLKRIEVATDRVQTIGGEGSSYPRGAAWNENGQILFAPNSNSGIHLIDRPGDTPREITTPARAAPRPISAPSDT